MVKYSGYVEIELFVNNESCHVVIQPSDTLLSVIREKLGLTGPKMGCENGDCGACTVLIDGKPIKACLTLAVENIGKAITTVEGLVNTNVQKAFVTEGGFQCGFCTAGFVVNAYALLEAHPDASEEEKTNWLNANLCRCTGYEGIRRAVDLAQANKKNGG